VGPAAAVGVLLVTIGSGCAQSQSTVTSAPRGIAATAPPTVAVRTTPAAPISWNVVSSPNPSGSTTSWLNGVTCVSASDCWAVGYSVDIDDNWQTLVEQDAGSGWNIISGPNPSGSTASWLNGVTCVSASDCWAVGYSVDIDGKWQTLVEQDAGSGWSIVSSPNPSGSTHGELFGVTCVGAGDCWAVGCSSNAAGGDQTLIEQDTGDGWNVVANPPDSGGQLWDVTCVSAGDCWAVGYSAGPSPLIEHYANSGWGVVSSGPYGHQLDGVTCVSAGDCWAAGGSVIVQYTEDGWSVVSNPTPADGMLASVACVSADNCWAVGTSGDDQMLIEQYAGSRRSVVSSPAVATGSQLYGVTCPSASDCWAVGWSHGPDHGQTLIVQGSRPAG